MLIKAKRVIKMSSVILGVNYKTKYNMIVPKGSVGELVAASKDSETGAIICQLIFSNQESHLFLNTQLTKENDK